MEASQIVYNQPHLIHKILYEYGGFITPSAIAFKKDCKIHNTHYDEVVNNNMVYYQTVIQFGVHLFRFVDVMMVKITDGCYINEWFEGVQDESDNYDVLDYERTLELDC
tara:strand:- start:6547 stop:6873 length:327 start_codon:yes stop_codon:yes gene_type:complete